MGRPYEFTLQLRWGDMDALNHVNNARYLDYAQEARVSFFLTLFGAAWGPLVVARQEVDYLRPLVYSDKALVVQVEVQAVGTRSFTVRQSVRDRESDGAVYARVLTIMAGFDRDAGGSRPLGEQERSVLTALLPAG